MVDELLGILMEKQKKGESSTQLNLLPNPHWDAQNTYPLDRSINVKLPFDSALSCLIILQRLTQATIHRQYTLLEDLKH